MSGKTALLLVDCQEDYFARDGLHPARAQLVSSISETLKAARSKGWPVFHIRTRVSADKSDAMPHRSEASEVIEGTPGFEPPPELREQSGEPVLFKRFFSAFDAPGFEAKLKSLAIEKLVIAGVHSHACVQATVLDGYARGFDVTVGEDLVGSYDPSHGAQALRWLDGRAARVLSSAAILGRAPAPWQHRNPCDADQILFETELTSGDRIACEAQRLGGLPTLSLAERVKALRDWHERLSSERDKWIDGLVRDLAKPRCDAQGEVDYGLALLAQVAGSLDDEEASGAHRVRYRPHGVAGLITPWNNPFAIPVAKLAAALGYGNSALWKPALPGSRIAAMLRDTLTQVGLGKRVSMVPGDEAAGRAVIGESDLISFTGSVPVGRMVVAETGRLAIPIQAELGGSNAAIVDESADLGSAATDLASAIFSFAGQRCTAIRRILVLDAVHDAFADRLVAAVETLRVGDPADPQTQVGPVIDKPRQAELLALASGRLLAGGDVPGHVSENGCWIAPTLLADPAPHHPVMTNEVFGPLAAIVRVPDFDAALTLHNGTGMGLVGALFSQDDTLQARFMDAAEAGILTINRARPTFSPEGPFAGWKDSGYGPPEHGRWNRDFYTRVQAIYRG